MIENFSNEELELILNDLRASHYIKVAEPSSQKDIIFNEVLGEYSWYDGKFYDYEARRVVYQLVDLVTDNYNGTRRNSQVPASKLENWRLVLGKVISAVDGYFEYKTIEQQKEREELLERQRERQEMRGHGHKK